MTPNRTAPSRCRSPAPERPRRPPGDLRRRHLPLPPLARQRGPGALGNFDNTITPATSKGCNRGSHRYQATSPCSNASFMVRARSRLLLRVRNLDRLRQRDGARRHRRWCRGTLRRGRRDQVCRGDDYHYRAVATNRPRDFQRLGHDLHDRRGRGEPANRGRQPTTTTTAELNGSLGPDSSTRTTTSNTARPTRYGYTVPAPPGTTPDTGSGTISVGPVTVGGLQQGSTYHFRIVATNSRGTTKARIATFQTADAPSIRSFWSEIVHSHRDRDA